MGLCATVMMVAFQRVVKVARVERRVTVHFRLRLHVRGLVRTRTIVSCSELVSAIGGVSWTCRSDMALLVRLVSVLAETKSRG